MQWIMGHTQLDLYCSRTEDPDPYFTHCTWFLLVTQFIIIDNYLIPANENMLQAARVPYLVNLVRTVFLSSYHILT